MKNEPYFSDKTFKAKAISSTPITKTILTPEDAIFLLIEEVQLRDLNLYYQNIKKITFSESSTEEFYSSLQPPENLSSEKKQTLFNIALSTPVLGNNIVNPTPNLFINTSSWIKHSLNVGLATTNLANDLQDTESKTAFVLGILHDIGKKFKTDMQHTIFGYEYLVNKGYENEARICLTHSQIHGKQCANNEPAVPRWSCQNGISTWDNSIETDDLTKLLNQATYNSYDNILTIADIMATESAILPIYDRLQDIKFHRKIDPTNKKFFFAELINLLNEYLCLSIIDEKKSSYLRN